MDWKQLLRSEIESTYQVADHLLELVDQDQLDWKPPIGNNWLTVGQLLLHITEACGSNIKGFVTGDWGEFEESIPENGQTMLPPAISFPTATSIKEIKSLLQKDQVQTLALLEACEEQDLSNKLVSAPWDPRPKPLGQWFLHMIDHLKQHKGQLYYYLKLQGKPVDTTDLWPN